MANFVNWHIAYVKYTAWRHQVPRCNRQRSECPHNAGA
ncbi:hypothetical protein DL346_07045 [Paenibacillus montanisoli]|uniref:Uncharacterized protein n=1 Tax=Paenibacillus montanisoli TaxID=2081970 RepID=A0A328U807_9BACL|nr:hypothetical protein DL346_07045 [Paenibacillus montanisoli]